MSGGQTAWDQHKKWLERTEAEVEEDRRRFEQVYAPYINHGAGQVVNPYTPPYLAEPSVGPDTHDMWLELNFNPGSQEREPSK